MDGIPAGPQDEPFLVFSPGDVLKIQDVVVSIVAVLVSYLMLGWTSA
jgi:hypothetical protein